MPWPTGGRRFWGSGRPRTAKKPATRVGCKAPRLIGRFPGRLGPPRPQKSTTPGRPKRHRLKTHMLLCCPCPKLGPGFLIYNVLASRGSSFLVGWATQSGQETFHNGGMRSTPPYWKVSRPLGAAPPFKIDDPRTAAKASLIKNPSVLL